jgi:hypothetical protein
VKICARFNQDSHASVFPVPASQSSVHSHNKEKDQEQPISLPEHKPFIPKVKGGKVKVISSQGHRESEGHDLRTILVTIIICDNHQGHSNLEI